ncbi:hypothetical protein CO008_03245 [Candidatus Roizmanbacteria bacterium CG_4_8_14_3_um_filter_36_12]|nr:MAG: hypothetical protein CO008_03245 [Candidatus Roizmanbacteria bacterium CG_4_8_14_3_um_filter_36_12]
MSASLPPVASGFFSSFAFRYGGQVRLRFPPSSSTSVGRRSGGFLIHSFSGRGEVGIFYYQINNLSHHLTCYISKTGRDYD